MLDLLRGIVPLVLLAAVSPVIFVNAFTVASRGGVPAAARFTVGNAIVLVGLGMLGMGLIGVGSAAAATRELESRGVDAVIAVVMFALGAWFARTWWRERHAAAPRVSPRPRPRGGPSRMDTAGLVGFGVFSMATNFTTIPLALASAQRIGASSLPTTGRLALWLAATAIISAPAWLPAVLMERSGRHADLSERTRARIASVTTLVSATACVVGGVLLTVHAL